eukprot:COSAG01_NODE_59924_length_297_cov_1.045455_1_plen_59_part_01
MAGSGVVAAGFTGDAVALKLAICCLSAASCCRIAVSPTDAMSLSPAGDYVARDVVYGKF